MINQRIRFLLLLLTGMTIQGFGVPTQAAAQARYAVIIGGIGGESQYTEQYWIWASGIYDAFQKEHGISQDRLFLLVADPAVDPAVPAQRSSLTAIEQVFTNISQRLTSEDLLFIILIGHGTATDTDAKLNIPGPDLSAAALNTYLKPVKASPIVLINGASSSEPFIRAITGPGRVIITATKSGAERLATVFPEHFLAALSIADSDLDKDGQVSVLEAFTYTRLKTAEWYEDQGRIATEHPLLDDNGDGVGSREPGGTEPDGALARTITFGTRAKTVIDEGLSPEVRAKLADLERKSQDIQRRIDGLRVNKSTVSESQYNGRMEELLIELARVNREIKSLRPEP